jgi:pyrroloquinoline quinone biosynthesis protein D
VITTESYPKVAAKARLRLDRITDRHLLLYPERGMILNRTAKEILVLCTGEQTVATIIDRLACRYAGQSRELIEQDVCCFLREMARRGLVREEP